MGGGVDEEEGGKWRREVLNFVITISGIVQPCVHCLTTTCENHCHRKLEVCD